MDPIQSHLLTVGITLLVVVVIYVVFYFKPKAEPVVEETLEALALKEFQTLQYLISKQKQDIAARQAALEFPGQQVDAHGHHGPEQRGKVSPHGAPSRPWTVPPPGRCRP